MPNVQIKTDDRIYKKKIKKLLKDLDKPITKNLPLFVLWFTQSAVKGTPPKKGIKKRSVIELRTNRYTKRGKELKRYKVPYKTNKKKGAKYFDKKGEARKFAKIKYRYVGKFGWLQAGEDALNKPLNVKMPKVQPEVKRIKRQLGKGKKFLKKFKPFVMLKNTVDRISRYATYGTKNALHSTQRRVNAYHKKIKREYKQIWQSQQ